LAENGVAGPRKQFEFYMDLLGHDILNSNQAVMSYLELILASPGLDKRTRMLAEKAIPHVRTSTLLIENVKRLIAARAVDPSLLKPIDLVSALAKAEGQVMRHFPDRRIVLSVRPEPKSARAVGGDLANDLLVNVLITAIRLSQADEVRLDISVSEGRLEGSPVWMVRIEDKDAKLPPFLDKEGIAATYDHDISVAVRTTGMLFAKMMANSLGGDFEARALTHDPKARGAAYTVMLRRAEGR